MESLTPDLFHIDYSRLLETLITLVVLSFLVERVLSVVFENRLFIDWVEAKEAVPAESDEKGKVTKKEIPAKAKKRGIRELIAVLVSVIFCFFLNFDAFTIIFQSSDKMTKLGMFFTGFIVAGGSKASMTLFKDLMRVMSSAEKERLAAKPGNNGN